MTKGLFDIWQNKTYWIMFTWSSFCLLFIWCEKEPFLTHLSQKNLTQIGQNDVGKSISLTNTERKEKHARLYHVFQMNGFFSNFTSFKLCTNPSWYMSTVSRSDKTLTLFGLVHTTARHWSSKLFWRKRLVWKLLTRLYSI